MKEKIILEQAETWFSAIWSDKLRYAIQDRSEKPYPIEVVINSNDFNDLKAAINQGIDSHLEAVSFILYKGEDNKIGFEIFADTLHVLVRRLLNSESENSQNLAIGICQTLGIELI